MRSCRRRPTSSRSIFFAATIIVAAFLPLFTLSGVEGNIFGPMARTYAYALAGGLLATFTVTPAPSAIILPAHIRRDRDLDRQEARCDLPAGAELGDRQPQGRDGPAPPASWSRPSSSRASSASNSCPSWKRAICGSAPRCRR